MMKHRRDALLGDLSPSGTSSSNTDTEDEAEIDGSASDDGESFVPFERWEDLLSTESEEEGDYAKGINYS